MPEHFVEYDNIKEDLVAFSIFHFEASATWRKARVRGRIEILAGALVAGFGLFAASGWRWELLGAAVLGGIVAVPICTHWARSKAHRLVREEIDESEGRGFAGRHKLTLQGDGLFEEGPSGSTHTSFASVQRIADGPEHVFVYVGPGLAHVIPRNRISSGDSEEFVRELRARATAA